MVALRNHNWTEAEYLAFENASETKHEYYRGEVYDMAGASPEHNRIAASALGSLVYQLRERPCDIFGSDQRVKSASIRFFAYPDISIVCGEAEFTQENPASLLNPTVIIEVLSPSTEDYDRGRKFEGYRTIAALQEYILIAQGSPKIEYRRRQADGTWVLGYVQGIAATLELPAIGCTLALAEVYAKVTFDADDALL